MMAFTPLPRLGPCPVAPDTQVRVQFRSLDGAEPIVSQRAYPAKSLRWDRFKDQKAPLPFDIIGYEVVGS